VIAHPHATSDVDKMTQLATSASNAIAYPSKRGPYERNDELAKKKILPQASYEQIAYKIMAKQK